MSCVCVCVSALGTVHTGMSCSRARPGCIPGCHQEAVGPYSFTTQLLGLGYFLTSPKTALGRDAELLASIMGSPQWA